MSALRRAHLTAQCRQFSLKAAATTAVCRKLRSDSRFKTIFNHYELKGNSMFKHKKTALITMVAVTGLLATGLVFAGTDTTFGTTTAGVGPVGTLSGWLQGSMGKLFAIGALGVGLAMGVVKQSAMAAAPGVGIALAASAGPTVLGAIFTAVI
jgi:conjugal transfer pilus assembly protein TraA